MLVQIDSNFRSILFQYDASIPLTDVWKAFEKLVEKGLVKSIGLSNFNAKQIKSLLEVAKV
jgi:aldehyde reductase